jgi:hypothetical protein
MLSAQPATAGNESAANSGLRRRAAASYVKTSPASLREAFSEPLNPSDEHHLLPITMFRTRHVHERPTRATCILHTGLHISASSHHFSTSTCMRGETAYFEQTCNPARLRLSRHTILDITGVCKNLLVELPGRIYPPWPGRQRRYFEFLQHHPSQDGTTGGKGFCV